MSGILKNPSLWICVFVIACGYTLWNTANGYIGTYTTRVVRINETWSSTLSIIRWESGPLSEFLHPLY